MDVCSNMKEMGVMEARAFALPIYPVVRIFHVFLGQSPGTYHFIICIQSIYVHYLGKG